MDTLPRDMLNLIVPRSDGTHRAALCCVNQALCELLSPLTELSERRFIWPGQALNAALRDDHVARVQQLIQPRKFLMPTELAHAARCGATRLISVYVVPTHVDEARVVVYGALRGGQWAIAKEWWAHIVHVWPPRFQGRGGIPMSTSYYRPPLYADWLEMLLSMGRVDACEWLYLMCMKHDLPLRLNTESYMRGAVEHNQVASVEWLVQRYPDWWTLYGPSPLLTHAIIHEHVAMAELLAVIYPERKPNMGECAAALLLRPRMRLPARWAEAIRAAIGTEPTAAKVLAQRGLLAEVVHHGTTASRPWLLAAMRGAAGATHDRQDVMAWLHARDATLAVELWEKVEPDTVLHRRAIGIWPFGARTRKRQRQCERILVNLLKLQVY